MSWPGVTFKEKKRKKNEKKITPASQCWGVEFYEQQQKKDNLDFVGSIAGNHVIVCIYMYTQKHTDTYIATHYEVLHITGSYVRVKKKKCFCNLVHFPF